MQFYFATFLLVLLVVSTLADGQKYSQRKRRSKEIEDRISKLDDATKKSINAMKASGMPKDAIAEKIAYVAGGKNVAKRIVDALHDEPEGKIDHKKKKAATPPKTAPKMASPKTVPPKTVPPKAAPSKVVPPKTAPPKTVPQKTAPQQKTVPPKTVPPKTAPKTVPLNNKKSSARSEL